jgi:hypothetical protein
MVGKMNYFANTDTHTRAKFNKIFFNIQRCYTPAPYTLYSAGSKLHLILNNIKNLKFIRILRKIKIFP